MTRPPAVTARIDTPDALAADAPTPADAAAAAAPAVYTVTVHMNTHRDNFDGYEPHHPLAPATRDGSAQRLVFHASDRIRSHEDAADAAFVVGNRQGADDHGRTWPARIRSVSVGDVVEVTGPDARTVHLSVDSYGFSPVPEPTLLAAPADPDTTHHRD
ncbi:hypothetical protein ACIQPS_34715 [Streptomyces sp. NPDC091290]|uniref:hypothetical protein n=1 Tax=Streptomyces sp. NPDC091290 TaxID=3365990 RepID=UPI003830EF2F